VPPAIEPRTLKGFRDLPPALMIPRERVLEAARRVYRSYGFAPIDTPALEYADVLLGKAGGETERQVYRFRDQGDRDVALRFDLTVPFARYAAQHVTRPDCGVPFKRYAMGPVWRGENTSPGRYREFWQCDFDTIGTTATSADAEVVLVVHDLFAALEIERFTIRLNNRLVLTGVLETVGVADKAAELLRSLDKLAKAGREGVIAEMVREAGVTTEQAGQVLALAETEGSNADILAQIEAQFGANPKAAEGIAKLREVLATAAAVGIPEGRVRLDLSIARGLDYYTGTIYETFLDDLPGIGSVCSGGRYDNLAGLYTNAVLPGVGASLGVDRLLTAMGELNHPWLASGKATPADVLVVVFDAKYGTLYQRAAQELRAAGVATEVYPEAKKPKVQFEYANRRGFRVALIGGPDEFAAGLWKVKDLRARTEATAEPAAVVTHIHRMLAGTP